MSDYEAPARLYRARNGVVFGVCRGVADWREISVGWVRLAVIVCQIFFWPTFLFYILAALLMKPAPVLPLRTEEDVDFYRTYTDSRRMALHRLKRTYDSLDRRIRRMETIVTAKDYDWERRLNA